jgi:hypothetical protein
MDDPRDVDKNPYAAPMAPLSEARKERHPWYHVSLLELVVVAIILVVLVALIAPAENAIRAQRHGRARHRAKIRSPVPAEPRLPGKNEGQPDARTGH